MSTMITQIFTFENDEYGMKFKAGNEETEIVLPPPPSKRSKFAFWR